jgi:ABC-type sulfate transport system substrate-binding protein
METSSSRRRLCKTWHHPAGWSLGTALVVVALVYGVQAILVDANAPVRLVIYAFSTQEAAFTQGIFPAFEAGWEAETGRALRLEGVFGPSGTLAGQINLGAPADIALFSNAQHASWLKLGRRIRRDTDPVVLGGTPMVIVTRLGNPLGVHQIADLSQEGVRLLHADPRSSGAGEWAVLAEYGSAWLVAHDPTAASVQLGAIWDNVRLLAPSARAALTLFELGAGDALMTYEQDARLAQERGVPLEIVVPPRTIFAQHVAVIVDDNVSHAERPAAEAFLRFLLSDAGQEILGHYHLRPAELQGDPFPPLVEPFTIDDLGGWPDAYTTIVEELWETRIAPGLDLEPAPQLLGPAE